MAMILLETSMMPTYMIHIKGSFSFIDYSKGRLSF